MMKLLCEGYNGGWLVESVEQVQVQLPVSILEHEGNRSTTPQTVQRMRIRAIIQEADAKNQNGRRYPSALWDRVLAEGSDFMSKLRNRDTLGELEHPESGNTHNGRVSHLWEKVWREGSLIKGECIVLKNPDGARMEELAAVGHRLGFSSRGRGEVQEGSDGIEEVKVNEYCLDTFDCVAKPSVEKARAEETTTPSGGRVQTESRDNRSVQMSTFNEGQIYAASQLLARADSTMAGVSKSMGQKTLDVSRLVEAQGQVSRLLAEMGAAQVPDGLRERFAEFRGRLNGASESIAQKLTAHTARRSPAAAAGGDHTMTALIEELQQRNVSLKQQLAETAKPVVNHKQYETAVKLGEELLGRARDQQVQIKDLQEQLAAAQELLEAVAAKSKGAEVQNKIKAALQDSLIRGNAQARQLIESCRTIQEVAQAVTLIRGLVKSSGVASTRDPLPPVGGAGANGQPLVEARRGIPVVPQKKQHSESLFGRLAEHEARASSPLHG